MKQSLISLRIAANERNVHSVFIKKHYSTVKILFFKAPQNQFNILIQRILNINALQIWNSLQPELKSTGNINTFKQKTKEKRTFPKYTERER